MPITRYPEGSAIDVTQLNPFTGDASGITGTGAYVTALNLSGMGFLESFYAKPSAAAAVFNVRITVDGVIKVLLGTTTNRIIGVVNKKDIRSLDASGNSAIVTPNSPSFNVTTNFNQPTAFKNYPTTDGTDGIIMLGNEKIWFYESLLLEVRASNTITTAHHYNGGYR